MPAGAGRRNRLFDDFVESNIVPQLVLARRTIKIPQPLYHRGGVETGSDDGVQVSLQFFAAQLAFAFQQRHFTEAEDDGQGIVEIVRDAAGHGAKGVETFLLDRSLLRLSHFSQGLLKLARSFRHEVLEVLILRLHLDLQLACPQQICHPLHDLSLVEWLRQKIMCSAGDRAQLRLRQHVCCQDKGGQESSGRNFLLQLFKDGEPIEVRHLQIEEDDVRLQICYEGNDIPRIGC